MHLLNKTSQCFAFSSLHDPKGIAKPLATIRIVQIEGRKPAEASTTRRIRAVRSEGQQAGEANDGCRAIDRHHNIHADAALPENREIGFRALNVKGLLI